MSENSRRKFDFRPKTVSRTPPHKNPPIQNWKRKNFSTVTFGSDDLQVIGSPTLNASQEEYIPYRETDPDDFGLFSEESVSCKELQHADPLFEKTVQKSKKLLLNDLNFKSAFKQQFCCECQAHPMNFLAFEHFP